MRHNGPRALLVASLDHWAESCAPGDHSVLKVDG